MDFLKILCLFNISSKLDKLSEQKSNTANKDMELTSICYILILLTALYLICKPLLYIFLIAAAVFIAVCFVWILINQKKLKQEQELRKNTIRLLAKKFIDETLTISQPELTQKDYLNFNKIIQVENNIKISNDYATEVPYLIRNILYTEFQALKKRPSVE
ncbi:MAG: hypothetical protein BHW55_06455 [Candidatus Melainabacteria bacterium 35_41]|nr:MAG: hypothetical protein BHW55_06455 [Candidatus Melainabacteria bacterium 35_41]